MADPVPAVIEAEVPARNAVQDEGSVAPSFWIRLQARFEFALGVIHRHFLPLNEETDLPAELLRQEE